MTNTVKILEPSEMKFLKRVNIVSPNFSGRDTTLGFLLYERIPNEGYNFIAKKNGMDDFQYLLSYPKQENYPKDIIDETIFQSIKIDYPNSSVHNDFLFSSADIENLNRLTKFPFEKGEIVIKPDFSEVPFEKLIGKEFDVFRKEINIYTSGPKELITNLGFYGQCDFSKHQEIYKLLNVIQFL
jgi:hypothetical protein